MNKDEATDYIHQRLSDGYPLADIAELLAQELNAPLDAVTRFVSQVAANYVPPEPPAQVAAQDSPPVPGMTSPLADPALSQSVLEMLRRHRKRSDIVLWVCEQSGAEWSQAQRFVAQVAVDNHRNISAHKGFPMIVLAVLFIAGGVGLLVLGFLSLAPLFNRLTGTSIDFVPPIYLSPETALGGMVTGLGMLIGGSVGIYFALQSQSQ